MPLKRRLMAEQWSAFATQVLTKDTPQIQRREMRRAFYAGAQAIMFKVLTSLAPESDPTMNDLELLNDLYQEVVDFSEQVQAGRA